MERWIKCSVISALCRSSHFQSFQVEISNVVNNNLNGNNNNTNGSNNNHEMLPVVEGPVIDKLTDDVLRIEIVEEPETVSECDLDVIFARDHFCSC